MKCKACGQSTDPKPVCPMCKHEIVSEHPGWITVRFFGLLVIVTLALYGQATRFDHTELFAIATIAAFVAPAMYGGKIIDAVRKVVN